jgi:hypothetical protein
MTESHLRSVTIAKDLAVTLQKDRPGMLAKAAEAIASGGLNLDGFAEIEGILHMVTSDARSARLALEAVGLPVVGERDVVVVQAVDRAGTAAALFGRLAGAGLNVAYTYVASRNRIVIAADDVPKAVAVLRR